MRLGPASTLLALLASRVVPASAAELAPRVRMVARGELDAAALSDGASGDRARLLVRVDGGAATLAAAGFDARPLTGDLADVRADAAALRRLATLASVHRIDPRRLLFPSLDKALPALKVPEARAATGLSGKGVLVGVVDTGCDIRHADLRDPDGKTRIAALLDLSLPRGAHHPELGDLPGRPFLRDEIDAQLAAPPPMPNDPDAISPDINGHGTHVSSVAVSNGLATDKGLPAGRYLGVAPAAELLIVQAAHGGSTFSDADVLAGAKFVVDEAARLGRPLVLNLSLGGPGGPQDGSSGLEAGLDALFPPDAPGRALVIAAGNEGSRDFHAGGWQIDGEVALPLSVFASSGGQVQIETWVAGAASISVISPSGPALTVAPGKSDSADLPDGRVRIDNGGGSTPRADGRSEGSIVIGGPSAPAKGTWTLRLAGRVSRYDLYLVDQPLGASPARFTDHLAVDDRLSLPATARNAIVVGSMITRASWPSVDGTTITRASVLGDPSIFSALGPTHDGRFAPDVLAPGEYIIGARSSAAGGDQSSSAFYVPGMPNFAIADDGLHGVLRGTSQASPMVAGAIALLLEADATLDGRTLRELVRTSAADSGTGWGPRTGFGRLDVSALTRLRAGLHGTVLNAQRSSVGLSRDALPPGAETTTVTVTPRDGSGAPLGPGRAVTIEASGGVPIGPVADLGRGRYERTFAAGPLRGVAARISVTVDDQALDAHPIFWVVRDRSEIGQPFKAVGGCRTAPAVPLGTGALGLTLALGLAYALSRARGRRQNSR